MSDWFFDDGSAATLLQSDVFNAGGEVLGAWDGATSSATTAQYGATQTDGPTTVGEVVVPGPTYGSDGGGAGGGSTWWEGLELTDTITPGEGDLDAPCTPPAEGPVPTGVDIADVRKAARDLADAAAAADAADGLDSREWAGILWVDQAGVLHSTGVYGSTTDQHAVFPIGRVGDQGRIVATFHSHPDRGNGDPNQGIFNPDDRSIASDLASSTYAREHGITADANALIYVNDDARDELKEFDAQEGRNEPGVLVGPCGS